MKWDNAFLQRMEALLGEKYDDFLASLDRPQEKALYVNENKISVERFCEIVDFHISPISYEKAGFYIDNEKKGRHPLHHAGAFYIQEPSAMFTVNALKFRGNEKVLDMCSAPGGKSIQIANRIPDGVLVSNEIVKSRSEILYSNIERMGLKNVIISNDTPENISKAYGDSFDVCLVDAPCSGEGMFRRGEKVVEEWNENLPKMCAERQMDILSNADKVLKKGGCLIYSTCTYSIEENEAVVKEFAKRFDYEILNIEAPFSRGVDLPEVVRLYPHENKGEGQFVALMKKRGENNNPTTPIVKLGNSKITNDFIYDVTGVKENIFEYKGDSYFVPDKSMIKKGVNYVSIGVRLGCVESYGFDPHHYLFTAFGKEFVHNLDLAPTSDEAKRYLRGETLDVDLPDCFGALLIDGCPVGGFKMSKGKFKNYYPKGLRNF